MKLGRFLVAALALALAPVASNADDTTAQDGATAGKSTQTGLAPLAGTTIDYDYDAAETGRPERAWMGRAFVHDRVRAAKDAVPILVFLHGLNAERIKYRWMGGGKEGDVRRIVAELIESGRVPPMIVAGPSSTDPQTMLNALYSWPAFDLDTFLDKTDASLAGIAKVDRSRVIVAGHSGAGCNVNGGIASAIRAKATNVMAGLVIDVCMATDLAVDLAKARPTTNVVVTWQDISWPERPTTHFQNVFRKAVKTHPPDAGVLRELDVFSPVGIPFPHDAMVPLSLRKWLPALLSPPQSGP